MALMNKQNIIDFFDRLAPDWDSNMVRHEEKISAILDFSGVRENVKVLDVACGTGVLIPDYLARNVNKVIGVDVSPAMIEIARAKFSDTRVSFINGDIEELSFQELFHCCVVYNAFPHFPEPGRLIKTLSSLLKAGGRLTIAHGMSREKINAHHSESAGSVSLGLISETELAGIMGQYLKVDIVVANDDMYVVSGFREEV